MKTLVLLSLLTLAACSKPSKDLPRNGTKVSVNAVVVDRHWNVSLSTGSPIVSKGTATVEWDVYSNGTFGYTKQATVAYSFDGTNVTALIPTDVQGAASMTARNGHILSMSGSGGYTFQ